MNAGIVSGGTSKNTVPDRAECQLDLRFETVADGEKLVSELRAAADAHGVEGVSIATDGGVARQPLERTDASVALMKSYAACAIESGLGGGEAALIGGGSDASTSFAMGIASIDGLGPRGIGFHTKDEQIEIATLVIKLKRSRGFFFAGNEKRSFSRARGQHVRRVWADRRKYAVDSREPERCKTWRMDSRARYGRRGRAEKLCARSRHARG